MLVHALVTTVGTSPEPTILLVLDRLDEVLANLVGGGTGVSVLAHDNAAQLLLVPCVHGIGLLCLFGVLCIARIGVQILLGSLALDVQVVTEFTLATLLTATLLVELTQYGLRVDTKGHLLNLHWLEKVGSFPLRGICGILLCLKSGLLGVFALLIGVTAMSSLCLQLLNLFLGGTTFFLFKEYVSGCLEIIRLR